MDAGAAGAALQLVGGFGALADLDVRPVALQVALREALGDGGWCVVGLRQFDLAGRATVWQRVMRELVLKVGGRALLAGQVDPGGAVMRLVQYFGGGGHTAVQAADVALLLVLWARMRMARRGDCVGVAVVAGLVVEGRAL